MLHDCAKRLLHQEHLCLCPFKPPRNHGTLCSMFCPFLKTQRPFQIIQITNLFARPAEGHIKREEEEKEEEGADLSQVLLCVGPQIVAAPDGV